MSDVNPYAPPAVVVPPTVTASSMNLATQGQRFVNMLIDGVAVNVLSSLAGAAMGFVVGLSVAGKSQSEVQSAIDAVELYATLFSLVVHFLYYAVLESLWGRTLGKLCTGTRVVTDRGVPPSLSKIVGRSFARFIPFEPFSFFGGSQPVGWHDSLSGTRVIKNS